MLGKQTILLLRVPWNIRNSRVYSGWWLVGLHYQIFQWMWHPVDLANTEACHHLKSKARPKKVIVKLSKRKDVFNILQHKKKLKPVDIAKVGLPQGSLIFINQSLCSYYKYLWSLCKRLHLEKLIHSFWVSNGNVNLKVCENTLVLLVSHVSDLEKHFDIRGLVGEAEDQFLSFLVVFIILFTVVHSVVLFFAEILWTLGSVIWEVFQEKYFRNI